MVKKHRSKKQSKPKYHDKQSITLIIVVVLVLSLPLALMWATRPQKSQQFAQTVPSGYPASDGQILWDGDWETGDTSQWSIHAGGSWGNSTVTVVTSPVRYGKYAGKLTLNPGSGNVRAEITSSQADTGGYPGQAWYYSFSAYFPSNPDASTGWSDWNDFTQWMDMRANCSPPIGFYIHPDGHLYMSNEITLQQPGNCGYGNVPVKDYDLGPIVYDQWIDFTAYFKWSEDPTVGFAQVWRDGQKVVPLTHMQTLDPGSTGVYMEEAMYRPSPTNQAVVYIDGTRRHTAFAAGSTVPGAPSLPASVTPSYGCIGSCPTLAATAPLSPVPSLPVSGQPVVTGITPPTQTSVIPTQPCQATNQSVTAEVHKKGKSKHGSKGNTTNLLQQLLQLLEKLLQWLQQLLGGNTPGTGHINPC